MTDINLIRVVKLTRTAPELRVTTSPAVPADIIVFHELEYHRAIAEQNARCNPPELVAGFTRWIDSAGAPWLADAPEESDRTR